MSEKRLQIPDWTVHDFQQQSFRLWDFRQKTHVILIVDAQATPAAREQWEAAIRSNAAKWEWLRAKFIFVAKAPPEIKPGVYFIDRWGILWKQFTLDEWSFESLENEIIYYEARHC